MAIAYEPGTPPVNPQELGLYLQQEFGRMKEALESAQPSIRLTVTTIAPSRFQNGDLFEAKAPWNPGAGDGLYIRRSGAWVLVG